MSVFVRHLNLNDSLYFRHVLERATIPWPQLVLNCFIYVILAVIKVIQNNYPFNLEIYLCVVKYLYNC